MENGLIGVTNAITHMHGTDWLKKELLIYDKVGLLWLDICKMQLESHSSAKAKRAERYEWLQEKGAIFEAKFPHDSENPSVKTFLNQADDAKRKFEYEHPSDLAEYRKRELEGRKPSPDSYNIYIDMHSLLSRATACEMQYQGIQAISMDSPRSFEYKGNDFKSSDVVRVLIKEFPVISESVPFEDILALRKEEEFKNHKLALRSWVRKTEKAKLNEAEIRDEIQYLVHDYKKYMEIQKIKFSIGTVESLVKLAFGTLEDVIKLNFRSIADTIFSVTKQRALLAEAELRAPGRELAYLVNIQERLRKP